MPKKDRSISTSSVSGISRPVVAKRMVCMRVAFHDSDGNHENDENDKDNSDSYINKELSADQGVTNVHLSNVHFVFRDTSALLDPSWGSRLPTLIHLVWKQQRGGGGETKEWKGGERWLRPNNWQRTKCTFVLGWISGKHGNHGNDENARESRVQTTDSPNNDRLI